MYVKRKVIEYVKSEWYNRSRAVKSLRLLATDPSDWGPRVCLDGSFGSKCLMKLMVGDVDSVDKRVHTGKGSMFHCQGCGKVVEDTLDHIVLECESGCMGRRAMRGAQGRPASGGEGARFLLGLQEDMHYEDWYKRFSWAREVVTARVRNDTVICEEDRIVYVLIVKDG